MIYSHDSLCVECSEPIGPIAVIGIGINHQQEDHLPRLVCVNCSFIHSISFPKYHIFQEDVQEWVHVPLTRQQIESFASWVISPNPKGLG